MASQKEASPFAREMQPPNEKGIPAPFIVGRKPGASAHEVSAALRGESVGNRNFDRSHLPALQRIITNTEEEPGLRLSASEAAYPLLLRKGAPSEGQDAPPLLPSHPAILCLVILCKDEEVLRMGAAASDSLLRIASDNGEQIENRVCALQLISYSAEENRGFLALYIIPKLEEIVRSKDAPAVLRLNTIESITEFAGVLPEKTLLRLKSTFRDALAEEQDAHVRRLLEGALECISLGQGGCSDDSPTVRLPGQK